VVASEKRRVSAAEVEALGLNRDRRSWSLKESGGIRIGKGRREPHSGYDSIGFDASRAQKYAHAYDQSAIAD
jgi:hypothetical protein